MTVEVELAIEAGDWNRVPEAGTIVVDAITAAADRIGVELAAGAEVSVLLTDDEAIRTLNRTWRQKDKSTNVLSFPAVSALPLGKRPLLGDVAIAWETTAAEAEADGKPLAHHLAHLSIHGFLHLIGYDHETDGEAELMEAAETAILASLGIADPHTGDLLTGEEPS